MDYIHVMGGIGRWVIARVGHRMNLALPCAPVHSRRNQPAPIDPRLPSHQHWCLEGRSLGHQYSLVISIGMFSTWALLSVIVAPVLWASSRFCNRWSAVPSPAMSCQLVPLGLDPLIVQ